MVRRRIVASLSFSFVVAFVSILIFGCWFQFGGTQEIIAPVVVDDSEREGPRLFFHVSDFHYDPLADPVLYNSSTSCRSESEFRRKLRDMASDEVEKQRRGAELQSSLLKRRGTQQDTGMYGRFGCDSPMTLVEATLQEMKRVWATPDWIFITGDLAAHGLPNRGEAMEATTRMMKRAFPDVPLYFCFGNNDVAETNYQMDCSSEWLEFAYSLWGKYIPDDQKKTFLQMGAYRVNISHSQQPSVFETKKAPLRLLVLNTMLYSVRSNHKYEKDPCGQFEWMENELQEARNDSAKVYLMSHIMPGTDSYGFTPLWNFDQNARYFDLLQEYSDVIAGQFYGHVHNDEFRVYGESAPGEKKSVPEIPQERQQRQLQQGQELKIVKGEKQETLQGLVNPAVSPIYGNNPEFRLTSYNPETFAISDYRIHYMDLLESNEQETPIWNFLYSFESYHVGEADKKGLSLLYDRLFENEEDFDNWYSYRGALGNLENGIPEQGSPGWACLLCALSATDQDSFEKCIEGEEVTKYQCSNVH